MPTPRSQCCGFAFPLYSFLYPVDEGESFSRIAIYHLRSTDSMANSAFEEAIRVTPLGSHRYSVHLHNDWCVGTGTYLEVFSGA